MEDTFEIPIKYRGEELEFTSRLLMFGFSYKIEVDVFGQKVMFEPDEERNFRAIVDIDTFSQEKIRADLLKEIAEEIEAIVRQ